MADKTSGLLSVVITTNNRPESVKKAIKSVLAQTYSLVEMIVVEDGTDSGIEAWLQGNGLKLIRYIRHKKNQGLAAARNTAIEMAAGEYFAFCDDDDQWPVDFAERLVNALLNGPEDVGMSIALADGSRSLCQPFLGEYPSLRQMMYRGCTPPVGSQLYKTKIIRKVGGYNSNVKSGVDHDLWISLAVLNPKVAISWGETAIVGSDLCANRMTTVEEKRREKIAEALIIWKPKIIDTFGEGFYKHFCYSYQQYLNYKFFWKDFQSRDYVQAVRRLFDKYVLRKILQKCFNKLTGHRNCGLFPVYKSRIK